MDNEIPLRGGPYDGHPYRFPPVPGAAPEIWIAPAGSKRRYLYRLTLDASTNGWFYDMIRSQKQMRGVTADHAWIDEIGPGL